MGQEPENEGGQEPPTDDEKPENAGGQAPKTFDEAYVKSLRDEAAAARTAKKDLEQKVKDFEDAKKSDTEKLEERATTAEGKLTSAERKLMRFEVAAEKGLDPKHAHRLVGDTKDDLAKDADALVKELGGGGTGFDGGARGDVDDKQDMDSIIRRAGGRAS